MYHNTMIVLTWITVILCALAALVSLVVGCVRKGPNDYSLGAQVLVLLALIAHLMFAIIAPITGNGPRGDALEFWLYLIAAIAIPIAASVWALVERSRWTNFLLAIADLSLAIMAWRMFVIWQG